MEKKILFLLAWLMLVVTGCSADEPQTELPDTPPEEKPEEPLEPSGDKKVLVVYFSHTGNTRTIAGYIHETVKSDLVEIKTVDTYTDDYDALLAQVRKEVADEYCPPLSTTVENISSYDIIFIGYPIWVETAAPPIRSFLTTHDLTGKTVVPFCTHGGSRFSDAIKTIREMEKGATVLDGYAIARDRVSSSKDGIQNWLKKIGMTE